MSARTLTDSYAEAFAGHLSAGANPALLLVDIVTAYLKPSSPLFCASALDALECATELLEAARGAGRTVVFTNVVYEPGGADGGLFYQKVPSLRLFDRGSPFGAFPPALQPQCDELVISKQYPSAFFGTDLTPRLRDASIDTLVIGGFSTSGCVRASALDALQHGFAPFVARDACADCHPEPHEANLFDLQAKYAEVVDLSEARRILTGD